VIPGDICPEHENYFGEPSRDCQQTYEWLITYEDDLTKRLCKPAVIAAANLVTAGESYSWDWDPGVVDGIVVHLCLNCGNAFIEMMQNLGDDYQKYKLVDDSDHGDTGDYFAQFKIYTADTSIN